MLTTEKIALYRIFEKIIQHCDQSTGACQQIDEIRGLAVAGTIVWMPEETSLDIPFDPAVADNPGSRMTAARDLLRSSVCKSDQATEQPCSRRPHSDESLEAAQFCQS